VTIRPATTADVSAIARIHLDNWRAEYRGLMSGSFLDKRTYEEQEDFWHAVFRGEHGDSFVCVAEASGREVVGFASGGSSRPPVDQHAYSGELYSLHVAAPYQRQGVGRSLMQTAAHTLFGRGHLSMMLWVLAGNGRARSVYEHTGGVVFMEREVEYGGAIVEEVAYGWTDIATLLTSTGRA
jgi:ribosomal protein S18 acetylase RimI-like enzyme